MSEDDSDLIRARLSPAMVSPDGLHWHEIPEGTTPQEFMAVTPGQGAKTPDREVAWEAIVCYGCGRRLFNHDGSPARSWRRWISC